MEEDRHAVQEQGSAPLPLRQRANRRPRVRQEDAQEDEAPREGLPKAQKGRPHVGHRHDWRFRWREKPEPDGSRMGRLRCVSGCGHVCYVRVGPEFFVSDDQQSPQTATEDSPTG